MANRPQVNNLPRRAAEPQTSCRRSRRSAGASGRRINNRPQVNNLPHNKIVAGCKESNA